MKARRPPMVSTGEVSLYSRADLDDGAVRQHALLPAVRKQVLHRLVRESDFLSPVWEMFL